MSAGIRMGLVFLPPDPLVGRCPNGNGDVRVEILELYLAPSESVSKSHWSLAPPIIMIDNTRAGPSSPHNLQPWTSLLILDSCIGRIRKNVILCYISFIAESSAGYLGRLALDRCWA